MNSTFIFDIQYQEQIPIIFQKKKSYLRTRVIWRLNAYRARYNSRPFPSLITLITLPLLLTPSHGISLGRMERSSIQHSVENSARFGSGHRERTAHTGAARKSVATRTGMRAGRRCWRLHKPESVAPRPGIHRPAESIRSIDPCAPYLHSNTAVASRPAGN